MVNFNESSARRDWSYGWTPEHNDVRMAQLSPNASFPPDRYGFEGMDDEEREQSDKNG